MLLIGQERSKFDAALAVESRCDRIVLVATATGLTLEEFQVLTTAAQRRPLLLSRSHSAGRPLASGNRALLAGVSIPQRSGNALDSHAPGIKAAEFRRLCQRRERMP